MTHLRNRMGKLLGAPPLALQVGALCVGPKGVLLITSRGTRRWIIPKGWPMAGRTLAEAAAIEAWEEAGVRGKLHKRPVGRYTYDKVQEAGLPIPIEVQVFRLDVTSTEDEFPEAGQRVGRWLKPSKAATMVAEPKLARIIASVKI